jgi:hypothetical protein
VLNSNRQGFPVAFLYSNKVTEDILQVFLTFDYPFTPLLKLLATVLCHFEIK